LASFRSVFHRNQPGRTPQFSWNRSDRTKVIVDDVPTIDREHQTIGVGFVREAFVPKVSMLYLSTRSDQFVLVFPNESVTGHRFEVRNVSHRADVPPGTLNVEETFEQELVCDIRENSADVDVAHRTGFDAISKGSTHHFAMITEVAPGISVSPSCFEQ